MDTTTTSKAEIASPIQDVDDELQHLLQTLPKEEGWTSARGMSLYFYQGFWCSANDLKPVISFQTHFQTFDSDVIVATFPKCGTTWLKAFTFSTLYRTQFARDENPLLPLILTNLFLSWSMMFTGTILFPILKISVFISQGFLAPTFLMLLCQLPLKIPNASQENPNKILFLKYEDLKEDISCQLKHLATFLEVPFTEDEEKRGVVEDIAKVCSFENLKELQVNKKGLSRVEIPHKDYFRKGEVGDWSNYLTPSMVERLEKLIHEKLDNLDLTFKLSSKTSMA
ncbi:hypothetical protein V6N13_008882 [Hibiscus sabdariffa]